MVDDVIGIEKQIIKLESQSHEPIWIFADYEKKVVEKFHTQTDWRDDWDEPQSRETTKSASSLLMNHIHYEASSFTYSP